MAALYEARARADKAELESLKTTIADQKRLFQISQEGHAIELAQVKERAAKFKSEAAIHQRNAVRTANSNIKIVERSKSLEKEVDSLKQQLSAKDSLLEAKVKRAKSELKEKYASLIDVARADLESLKEVQIRAIQLAQTKGNVELIEDIRGDRPMDLEVELAELQDHIASDSEGGREASSLLAKAIDRLVIFQVSPNPIEVFLTDETILHSELAQIGVTRQYGSNIGSPLFQIGANASVRDLSDELFAAKASELPGQVPDESAKADGPITQTDNPAEKAEQDVPVSNPEVPL